MRDKWDILQMERKKKHLDFFFFISWPIFAHHSSSSPRSNFLECEFMCMRVWECVFWVSDLQSGQADQWEVDPWVKQPSVLQGERWEVWGNQDCNQDQDGDCFSPSSSALKEIREMDPSARRREKSSKQGGNWLIKRTIRLLLMFFYSCFFLQLTLSYTHISHTCKSKFHLWALELRIREKIWKDCWMINNSAPGLELKWWFYFLWYIKKKHQLCSTFLFAWFAFSFTSSRD